MNLFFYVNFRPREGCSAFSFGIGRFFLNIIDKQNNRTITTLPIISRTSSGNFDPEPECTAKIGYKDT